MYQAYWKASADAELNAVIVSSREDAVAAVEGGLGAYVDLQVASFLSGIVSSCGDKVGRSYSDGFFGLSTVEIYLHE